MHTPGKVGSGRAYLRLVLLHDLEAERLAMGHRLVSAGGSSGASASRHKATVSTKAGMLKAGHL